MTRLRVEIAADGSAATIAAAAGDVLDAAAVRAALAAAGVVAGIDERALAAFVSRLTRTTAVERSVVASGTPPVPGQAGRLELAAAEGPTAGEAHSDGSVDFRERHLLQPVAGGDVIARIVPPGAGTAGRDVRGRDLAAPAGLPFVPRPGTGVRVDGDRVVATRGGAVRHSGAEIDVTELYVHRGDVDYRSGNLHSAGAVHVRGDVAQGFTVEADGDVRVDGAVLGASVHGGGSVHVAQGVLGGSDVSAGGDLFCRHATSARLCAKGDLVLRDQATHGMLRGARIRVLDGRGAVVGGRAVADERIEVRTAGTEQGAGTLLGIGVLLDDPATAAQRDAEAARDRRIALRSLRDSDARPAGKIVRRAAISADAAQLERARLRRQQRERLATAEIRVAGTAHAGVRVQIGDRSLVLEAAVHAVVFRLDGEGAEILQEEWR